MKKVLVDKKDLEQIKEWALQYFKEYSQKDMDDSQFRAMSFLHACNIFFRRLDTEYVVEYKYTEFQDPVDDRMG